MPGQDSTFYDLFLSPFGLWHTKHAKSLAHRLPMWYPIYTDWKGPTETELCFALLGGQSVCQTKVATVDGSEILQNNLGCIKPCKWRKLYISSRSSSINSISIQYIAALRELFFPSDPKGGFYYGKVWSRQSRRFFWGWNLLRYKALVIDVSAHFLPGIPSTKKWQSWCWLVIFQWNNKPCIYRFLKGRVRINSLQS